MATKVKVELTNGHGEWTDIELSGASESTCGNGTHTYNVGLTGSSVHMLTIRKKSDGNVKITALDGVVNVSIDRGKDKKLSKGKSLTLSSKAHSMLIREKA